jgi:hypothetical protein
MSLSYSGRRWLLLGLLALSLTAVAASGFVVTRVDTRLRNGAYKLDARVEFHFSDTALEALDNGVPLTIEARVQVRHKGAWIWTRSLVDRRQMYLIRYRPLAELYEVTRLPDGPRTSFVTRAAAIDALGDITDVPLVAKKALDPNETYEVHFKVSLDVEALPLPLRPLAYLKPSWDLTSGWTQWPFER